MRGSSGVALPLLLPRLLSSDPSFFLEELFSHNISEMPRLGTPMFVASGKVGDSARFCCVGVNICFVGMVGW